MSHNCLINSTSTLQDTPKGISILSRLRYFKRDFSFYLRYKTDLKWSFSSEKVCMQTLPSYTNQNLNSALPYQLLADADGIDALFQLELRLICMFR